jgi:hypothetical protein
MPIYNVEKKGLWYLSYQPIIHYTTRSFKKCEHMIDVNKLPKLLGKLKDIKYFTGNSTEVNYYD